MPRKLICILVLMVLISVSHAQVPDSLWSYTYDGGLNEICYDATKTIDGGYVLAGRVVESDPLMVYLLVTKTDSEGNSIWSYRYAASPNAAQVNSIIQASDSSFMLTGEITGYGPGSRDAFLMKLSSEGDSLWFRTYGGAADDEGNEVAELPTGGFMIVGTTMSFGSGYEDFWALRVSSEGDSLTSRIYGSTIDDICCAYERADDGGFVLGGFSSAFGSGSYDMWLLKYDILGNMEWMKSFGGSGIDQCRAMCKTNDGGYALAGWTANWGSGSFDIWLVKTNADGDSLWSRTYGGEDTERCYSIIQTADGGFALAGQTYSFGSGLYDYWIVKTDANGDSLWSLTLGTSDEEDCRTVMQTDDGGYTMAGLVYSWDDDEYDIWLARIDEADPLITSITDVGNDQGRRLRIYWNAAYWDKLNSGIPVSAYSIYRRIDLYRQTDPVRQPARTLDWPPGDWEYVLTVPARTEETYATIVPTLADSSSEGIYWSSFFVSAETANPGIFFDSPVDSGYSVDNLAPDMTLITAGLSIVGGQVVIRWEEVITGGGGQPELNGVWYRIHGSTDPDFIPSPDNLLVTTQTLSYAHPLTEERFFFKVLVSDDH